MLAVMGSVGTIAYTKKSDFDYFADDHARQAYEDELHIIQSGEPLIDKGEREIWPDGHQTWVSTTKMPFRNEAGEIIGTIVRIGWQSASYRVVLQTGTNNHN